MYTCLHQYSDIYLYIIWNCGPIRAGCNRGLYDTLSATREVLLLFSAKFEIDFGEMIHVFGQLS